MNIKYILNIFNICINIWILNIFNICINIWILNILNIGSGLSLGEVRVLCFPINKAGLSFCFLVCIVK